MARPGSQWPARRFPSIHALGKHWASTGPTQKDHRGRSNPAAQLLDAPRDMAFPLFPRCPFARLPVGSMLPRHDAHPGAGAHNGQDAQSPADGPPTELAMYRASSPSASFVRSSPWPSRSSHTRRTFHRSSTGTARTLRGHCARTHVRPVHTPHVTLGISPA